MRWNLWLALSLLTLVCTLVLNFYIGYFDWPISISAVVVVCLIWLLIIFLFRPLSGALDRLASNLSAVAAGEYDQKISPLPRNEAGEATLAFNNMAAAVSQVISTATGDRDRFSIILSNMPDGIFVVDSDSRITLVNPAARRMFKLDSEVVGSSFIEATHDAEVYRSVRLCLESGRQQSSFVETRIHRMYLGVVATPLQKSKGCILLVQDLTEIRRLETVRRDFVANISHELRTPMSSLKALAQTLNEGAIEDPAVAREFLERIDIEVDKLIQMTQELGELSNIESNVSALAKAPTNIEDVIYAAAERLQAQAKRAELEIVFDVPSGVPEVQMDRDRIERVLVNLIHNSIKFTSPGGQITVAAKKKADSMVVSVADTGIGIEPADLTRIFERFYKTDRSHSGGGTGLGLAIARHTVEAHGGKIWAESTPGKGTVIYFSLPL